MPCSKQYFDDVVIAWCVQVFGEPPDDRQITELWGSLFCDSWQSHMDCAHCPLVHLRDIATEFLDKRASFADLRQAARAAHLTE